MGEDGRCGETGRARANFPRAVSQLARALCFLREQAQAVEVENISTHEVRGRIRAHLDLIFNVPSPSFFLAVCDLGCIADDHGM